MSLYRKCPSCQSIIGVLAVMAFLLVNVGDIHSHFCLDGQEPAVSLHFENLNGHPEHGEDDFEHNDVEFEVSLKSIKIKTSDFSKLLLSATDSGIPFSYNFVLKTTSTLDEILLPQKPDSILPPLRAPPVLIS